MVPVKQEDDMGCAVACVAFVLGLTYQEAVRLFEDGQNRVKMKANFYCPEIVKVLNSKRENYKWKKIGDEGGKEIFRDNSIVFIKRSNRYPYGHFLVRCKDKWMDPWINLPDRSIEAGFRDELPGEVTYVIYRS